MSRSIGRKASAASVAVMALTLGVRYGDYELALIGNNLTDKLWVGSAGGRPFLPPGGDDDILSTNRGRQVFVEASFKF